MIYKSDNTKIKNTQIFKNERFRVFSITIKTIKIKIIASFFSLLSCGAVCGLLFFTNKKAKIRKKTISCYIILSETLY